MTEELGWQEVLFFLDHFKRIDYLQIMAQMWNVQVKTFVEIGVYKGKMSKDVRKYYPEAHLYLIDPWKLYDEYLSKDAGPMSHAQSDFEEAYASVRDHFAQDPKTTIHRCSSLEAASLVPNEIDLVFIDANHAYSYVKQDIETWYPKVRSGGIISGHDYNPELFPSVVQAVNECFVEQVTVGTHGVWLFQKSDRRSR